jgi:hypothetical protein
MQILMQIGIQVLVSFQSYEHYGAWDEAMLQNLFRIYIPFSLKQIARETLYGKKLAY